MAFESTANPSEADKTSAADRAAKIALDERLAKADLVIRRNVIWGFSSGILPLPLFDIVAATTVQVKMIKELSNIYGVPFREGLVRKLVTSLLFGGLGVGLGATIAISLGKLVPGVGQFVGAVMQPVTVGAMTHATGKVFVMHFEAGGTLLDFDARKMHDHFRTEFEKAKETVAKLFEDEKAKAGKRPA